YTQKSFHLPRATLPALARQFRFADALTRVMDETANESQATDREPIPFPGPCDGEQASPARQRRDA
ncbi:MAG: hypothetical protein R3336_02600, partial [Phycisphaeraceae bacterium]|nr:hypothetical protein [Phycisphaeraceae bacterium]